MLLRVLVLLLLLLPLGNPAFSGMRKEVATRVQDDGELAKRTHPERTQAPCFDTLIRAEVLWLSAAFLFTGAPNVGAASSYIYLS